MLEIDILFQPDGQPTQVLHLDLSPSGELPVEPTAAEVPGDVMWSVYANRCDGPCTWGNLRWIGNGAGDLSLHADDARVYLADLELGFPGEDEVPVKVNLHAAELANSWGW
jgi:hypothetical protein